MTPTHQVSSCSSLISRLNPGVSLPGSGCLHATKEHRKRIMKTGQIFHTFTAKDGREVILRTPKWEDIDDLLALINSLIDEEADIWMRKPVLTSVTILPWKRFNAGTSHIFLTIPPAGSTGLVVRPRY